MLCVAVIKMAACGLMNRGKRGAASFLQSELLRFSGSKELSELLDVLLDPSKSIDDSETIDWCRWLIAGGRTPDEFATTVRKYDSAIACGLVWTANFIAYRCRTCGISPCMSLCAECFQRGNHEGHDFNMFRSQAGGACDCGDSSVMKESGFCNRHGPRNQLDKIIPPPDLLLLAETAMPRIILRLIHHFRDKSSHAKSSAAEIKSKQQQVLQEAEEYLTMLHQFSELGAAMRHVMTQVLTNTREYFKVTEVPIDDSPRARYMKLSCAKYQEALKSLPVPDLQSLFEGIPDIPNKLVHTTLLEELVFWTVKFEFPQKLVCLLLNMMPDSNYKEAFTKTFVQHYGCISMMLVNCNDADTLSNRVVHVSVQLFSNEVLTYKMANEMHLLYIMVGSLKNMMNQILIQNTLHDPRQNFNVVVDCSKDVMKDHCYWPLVSDLNNVLSHRRVALKFMDEPTTLLHLWFTFLSMFQGMNVNKRELLQHIEIEPNTYYAAFSAELEASASPMWAMISHLKDSSTLELTRQVLRCCLVYLEDWFDAIGVTDPDQDDPLQVSFHLPLHRYFAVFLSQAVRNQGAELDSLLPQTSVLKLLMLHLLRAQVAFYEILCGLWVRNGLQIKGQAMTYIQCHFCNSMVDADLYLLQVCAAKLDPDWFLMTVFERFHIAEWLSFAPNKCNSFLESEQEMPMLESCVTFLATLLSVRTNTGLTEEELTKLEIVTLLCMGDKTHSQLTDLMPEKCGAAPQSKNFESILSRVATYKAPNFEACGHMLQGMYVPRDCVWEKDYDPIYVLLRAVHRRDYQASLDRYCKYVTQSNKHKATSEPWPPFRIPGNLSKPYVNIMRLLHCKTMHALIFTVLYKAVNESNVSETAMALCLYLLEMAVRFPPNEHPIGKTTSQPLDEVPDMEFTEWFNGSWILTNVQHVISSVVVNNDPSPTVHEDSDEMNVDNYEEIDMEMQEIMESAMFESSGARNEVSGMLEPSATRAALPNVTVPLALTAAQTSNALVPVPGNGMVVAHVTNTPTSSNSIMALTNTSNGQTVSLPGRRRMGRFKLLERNSAPPSYSPPNLALPAPPQPILYLPQLCGSPSLKALPQLCGSPSLKALPQLCGSTSLKALPCPSKNIIGVNESILSLLIKLHSKLSGSPDSYSSTVLDDSKIGDGPHFIGQILNRISMLSLRAARTVQEIRLRLWPLHDGSDVQENSPDVKDNADKEERRRRAKDRQQKLMAEFASKQKAFMEQTMETDRSMGDSVPASSQSGESLLSISKEYDCVICGQTTTSTEERPIGLVTLLQASSVLGHSRSDAAHLALPCSDEELQLLRHNKSKSFELDRRIEEFNRHFDVSSWLMALNIGLEGGVQVQTCGHHLHLDCHKSYIQSLRSLPSQRQQSLNIDRGEYSCPLCRQLANSVLPVSPDVGEIAAVVQSRTHDQLTIATELGQLIQSEPPTPQRKSNLMTAMGSIMEDMTVNTYPQYKCRSVSLCRESIFLFICSIARTNLELDIVQRGGNLCSPPLNPPKRPCFIPLLHVLAMHSKILSPKPYTQLWAQMTGLQLDDALSSLSVYEKEVPLLLKDMVALLLQLVLILPVHIDKAYYTCIVHMLYNVVYVQTMAQLSCKMSERQRSKWREAQMHEEPPSLQTLPNILGEIIGILEHSSLYLQDDDLDRRLKMTRWTREVLEEQVQQTSLNFLRVASLLQHHVYKEDLPKIAVVRSEFTQLTQYLGLETNEVSSTQSSASLLSWIVEDPRIVLRTWCQDYLAFVNKSQNSSRTLLDHHRVWYQPCLLHLPEQYERFFQYYHRKQCRRCNLLPKEPSVCLVCGTMVCLRESCCRQHSVFEAVQHSIDCGAGTAMFLAVNSSNVIVIRGKRVCLWGSVYLDSYGEEDKDLKRGKPLFLCRERYSLLEHQWLTHSFDHTSRRWIWHKDVL